LSKESRVEEAYQDFLDWRHVTRDLDHPEEWESELLVKFSRWQRRKAELEGREPLTMPEIINRLFIYKAKKELPTIPDTVDLELKCLSRQLKSLP
jgi:hypothetical protein